MPFKFSDKILQALPEGLDPANIRFIKCAAQIIPIEEFDAEEEMVMSSLNQARPELINIDNKPTVMRVVAWMVHEGVNSNRQGFVKEELAALAPDLFRAPNFGVMDFNHSAISSFGEDPKVIGLWHKVDYAFDAKANKWGLLATGMMWSWLFPEHADTLLAEQSRKGAMSFSMAAIPTSIEYVGASEGQRSYEVLHNPVFFTVSALDVPPADSNALGTGSELTTETDELLKDRLLAAAHNTPWQNSLRAAAQTDKGEVMEDNTKIIAELTEAKINAEKELAALLEKYSAATTDKETIAASLDALKTQIDELTTVREGLVQERDLALTKIAELEGKVTELESKLGEFLAKEAEKARSDKLAARIAELPEHIRVIHESKDPEVKTRVEDKWISMDDDKWTTYVQDELLGYNPKEVRLSFLQRSNVTLPVVDTTTADDDDIATRVRRVLR